MFIFINCMVEKLMVICRPLFFPCFKFLKKIKQTKPMTRDQVKWLLIRALFGLVPNLPNMAAFDLSNAVE